MADYFAYGSNLHLKRLTGRVPGARFKFIAELPKYQLRFNKRSDLDGSGKCNIQRCDDVGERVFGVVYALPKSGLVMLDAAESAGGGYLRRRLKVYCAGNPVPVWSYLAADDYLDEALRPFDWYKSLVLEGAKAHRLPRGYVAALSLVESIFDTEPQRRQFYMQLLGSR